MNLCKISISNQLSNGIVLFDVKHHHKAFHLLDPAFSVLNRKRVELHDFVASHKHEAPQVSVLPVLEVDFFESAVVHVEVTLLNFFIDVGLLVIT